MPKGGLKLTVIIFKNLAFFTIISFPVLMTFILSIMLYKWGEVLHSYNKYFHFQLRNVYKHKVMDHFADFLKIMKVLRDMNHVLNYPLLSIIFYSLTDIFLSLYNLLMWQNMTCSVRISVIMFIGSGVLMLVMYSISSSMITENFEEIRLTAQEKINEYVFGLNPSISENELMCLRRIETQKTIYINVFGMFLLTKSFILSAIGSIFAYDLLIINTFMLNKNNVC